MSFRQSSRSKKLQRPEESSTINHLLPGSQGFPGTPFSPDRELPALPVEESPAASRSTRRQLSIDKRVSNLQRKLRRGDVYDDKQIHAQEGTQTGSNQKKGNMLISSSQNTLLSEPSSTLVEASKGEDSDRKTDRKNYLPTGSEWLQHRPKSQRGDVQPLKFRRTVTVKPEYGPSASDKVLAMKVCLRLENHYLRDYSSQMEEFWIKVLHGINSQTDIGYRWRDWRHLRKTVDTWCEEYQTELMLRGKSPVRTASGSDLATAIEEWGKVCMRHNENHLEMLSQDLEFKIIAHIRTAVSDWTEIRLQKRREELLAEHQPPPLLNADSSCKEYSQHIYYLQERLKAGGQHASTSGDYKTEIIASLVAHLQPALEKAIQNNLQNTTSLEKIRQKSQSTESVEEDDEGTSDDSSDGDASSDSDAELDDNIESHEGSPLPSIEPRTPLVTPRTLGQLKYYEGQFRQLLRDNASKSQAKRSPFNTRLRKRKRQEADESDEVDAGENDAKRIRVTYDEPDSQASVVKDWPLEPGSDLLIRPMPKPVNSSQLHQTTSQQQETEQRMTQSQNATAQTTQSTRQQAISSFIRENTQGFQEMPAGARNDMIYHLLKELVLAWGADNQAPS
ncbi:hypothetical protein BGZ63DRAFT_402835 [Mariannaea sp. PMI_226]|nr:hypothetical protein BGZ63DRAFT_402835 [Mariannaea sp. PMI_226]